MISSKKSLLQKYIIHKVLNGGYKINEQLPSEAAFSIKFDVSRVQVRNALKELKYAGMINSKKGKGYFVTPEFGRWLNEYESDEEVRNIDKVGGEYKKALCIAKAFKEEIGIEQFNEGMLYGYKKQMSDEKGLSSVKVSMINYGQVKNVNLEDLNNNAFLPLAAYSGVRISMIKKKVIYSNISFLDKYAKEMGYGIEYPVVLTASYIGPILLDVSANVFRKDKFNFSINMPIFF